MKNSPLENPTPAASATSEGALIHAATAKTTPVDADEFPLADSAAAWILKKVTWANIKATLKTYFDTLYQSTSLALTANNTYNGFTIPGLANLGGVALWEVVYLNASSQWVIADANGSGTFPARGLATAAALTTVVVPVLTYGVVRNDSWNFVAGGMLYLSETPGGITQTAPVTSGSVVQQIGYAISPDIIFVDFNSTFVTLA